MPGANASSSQWKPASSLDDLTVSMPARYQRGATGQWKCPPGEAYAEQVGMTYRVRSSAEYHPLYIQNLKFLQDFWAHHVPIEAEQQARVQTLVATSPGIRLPEVLDVHPDLSVDVVWALLATRQLFTATSLMYHDQVMLYRHEAEANHSSAPPVIASHHESPSLPLVFDGRLWLAESVGEVVTLRPDVGEALTLPLRQFQHSSASGAMRIVTATDPEPSTPEIRYVLEHASPKSLLEANRRFGQVLAYVQGEKIPTPLRTVRRWMASYRAAEEQYGCGYVGLLDHVANRGNRNQRIPDTSMQLLEASLKTHYATPQAKRAAAVYRLYCQECEQHGIPPVSERTFYRVRARFTTRDVTSRRLGRRAAYGEQPFILTGTWSRFLPIRSV